MIASHTPASATASVSDVPPAHPFVHLHVHSQYSLLDGACRIRDMVTRAKELNQSALAITDHGCLFGAIDFYSAAAAAGVKPIVGIEAYMAPQSRHDRQTTGSKDGGYHLLLLAKNHAGYRNLLKLGSIAYTEGFYYKPRIDKEVLRAHSEGLICTSACLGGEIPSALTADDRQRAKAIAEEYLSIFGPDDFYIELQKHIPEQDQVNPALIDLADGMGVGLVATNDVHFLLKEDHGPHGVLCCISTGKLISDESRMKYPTQLYMKSGQEMYAAMDHPKWVEACGNTVRIAEQCELELDFATSYAPVVKIEKEQGTTEKKAGETPTPLGNGSGAGVSPARTHPIGSTEWYKAFCGNYILHPFDELNDTATSEDLKEACDEALRELSEAGLTWRYGQSGVTDEHRARLDRELRILADKNISAYFLIVWDFVNEARRRGIPCNARGSGVGTMVGYVLGLSNACPVKYGLLFERFTDPDRSEYPDIDIDICQDGRQAIIEYVRQKYGHVAQIITFGTLKARAAIRDVGRVLDIPLPEVDAVCKLIPDQLGVTLDEALKMEPDLLKLYNGNPTYRRLLDTARRLEGLARHAGVHAAGVVLATQPLDNIIPLYKPPGTEQLVTQWDGPTVEKVGLLKMDFLGLRTLSILERARQIIRESLDEKTIRETLPETDTEQPDPLDLERLSLDDQRVLDLFRRGETAGVFQFESGGMRNLLMAMKPDRLEDLIAANALFRPGPMELIPDYNDRKHRRQAVPKVHEIVDRFTAETYGIMVYQEQVMQIVHELGGIPLRAAYSLIKAISKKKHKVIDAQRPRFIDGSEQKGLSKQNAAELFDLILKFAGYGFNKSHSTGYAIVAYQTAYLKTYFPVQYMAAVLTYESVSTDKVVEYMDACKRVQRLDGSRGVAVRPPDINLSAVAFTVVYEPDERRDTHHGHIRFGLSAVKGVGEKAILAIIAARDAGGPFKSLYDFCDRVALSAVNKSTIEALIKCGAFDSVHGQSERAAMIAALPNAVQAGQERQSDRNAGQMSFFESFDESAPPAADNTDTVQTLPSITPWTQNELLKYEKDVLGLYLSSHPLEQHADALARFTSVNLTDARELGEMEIITGGMLTRVRNTVTKKTGDKMAMLTIEDSGGSMDAVVFPRTYARDSNLLEVDAIVLIKGKIDRKREEPNILVDDVIPIRDAPTRLTKQVRIVLRDPESAASNGSSSGAAVVNGDLSDLKTLLRQYAARNGAEGAQVLFEVHQGGQIVTLRTGGPRVAVDHDFISRVETVLGVRGCCELLGPAKINRQAAPSPRVEADPSNQRRLGFASRQTETCESIDRY